MRPPVILITAYGPFDGRGVNGSATVAHGLEGQVVGGCRIETVVMPVAWGSPQRTLPALVATWHPLIVLGLGEGSPHQVAVEAVGRNQTIPAADVTGALPPAPTLEAGGPPRREATVRFDPAWFAATPLPVVASSDAGGYLCNACLYVALGLPVARVGFVHLPPQGEVADATYAPPLSRIVRTLLERNLPAPVAASAPGSAPPPTP